VAAGEYDADRDAGVAVPSPGSIPARAGNARSEALAHFVDADGNASSEWESVTLAVPAIRDWLEY
jgi:hypothetical protein